MASDIVQDRIDLLMGDPSQGNLLINLRLFGMNGGEKKIRPQLDQVLTVRGPMRVSSRLQITFGLVDPVTWAIDEDAVAYLDERIPMKYGMEVKELASDLRPLFETKSEVRKLAAIKLAKKVSESFRLMGFKPRFGVRNSLDEVFIGDELWVAVSVSDIGRVKKETELDHLAGLMRSVEGELNDRGKGYGLLIAGAFSPFALQQAEKLRFACFCALDYYRFNQWISQQKSKAAAAYMNLILNRHGQIDLERYLSMIENAVAQKNEKFRDSPKDSS